MSDECDCRLCRMPPDGAIASDEPRLDLSKKEPMPDEMREALDAFYASMPKADFVLDVGEEISFRSIELRPKPAPVPGRKLTADAYFRGLPPAAVAFMEAALVAMNGPEVGEPAAPLTSGVHWSEHIEWFRRTRYELDPESGEAVSVDDIARAIMHGIDTTGLHRDDVVERIGDALDGVDGLLGR